MTGKEKIAEMMETGEFADLFYVMSCPEVFGLTYKSKECDMTYTDPSCSSYNGNICKDCWRKALESEVGE